MAIKVLFVATLAVMTSALGVHADSVDPAQAIAQKFSGASDEPAAKPAPKPASKPSVKLAPAAAKPDADYEADMLSRAGAEEANRLKQEARTRQVAAEPAATAPVAPIAALPVAAAPVTAAPIPAPPPAVTPAPEKQPAPVPVAAAVPTKPESERMIVAEAPKPGSVPATVLIVLDTNDAALGFKPDPIICIDDRCWLSNGIEAPAVSMPRTQAVALSTTEESTADSCAGKSACVYRAVSIDPDARIEVIEVGESRGASAGAYTVPADTSCRSEGGALLCDNGLATQNFRIWVVPEAIAASAGPSSIEDAIENGLPDPGASTSVDK
ncbi:hypothetical protein [Hyphomicrobium sp. ghe19]|uniref:hypothetical protein n=1 Tax=Hyphomicrobium sp. ghe19 TaxID=2682968 RepID=UPI0013671C48|nr:hypothetical protein HYPP_00257 [Hyphomicrobium sp. ghe19]